MWFVTTQPRKKSVRSSRVPGCAHPEALVHLREEAEQADRVDVEHGSGEPLVPGDRVVAREREDVVEALRAELPAATLERVAVPVLAREMDDHLLAPRDQIGPERVGREHRVPARVVGDREHVDARVGRELPRHLHHPAAAVRRDQPAARDDLRRDDERTGARELFAKRIICAAAFPISVCLIYHRVMADLQVLDAETARMVERVCDAIVPGSARVRPAVYVDALLARMDEGTRRRRSRRSRRSPGEIEEHVGTPEFLRVRALAIEAFYSDFVAPGVDATGAWAEIDFNTPARDATREGLVLPGDRMNERFDVVVVGSGAGGGVVAGELAERGRRVLLLETGPHKTAADFTRWEAKAAHDLWWPIRFALIDGGAGGAVGAARRPLRRRHDHDQHQGRAARPRRGLREVARGERHRRLEGAPFGASDLDPHYERVERRLGVRERTTGRERPHGRAGFRALGAPLEPVIPTPTRTA